MKTDIVLAWIFVAVLFLFGLYHVVMSFIEGAAQCFAKELEDDEARRGN